MFPLLSKFTSLHSKNVLVLMSVLVLSSCISTKRFTKIVTENRQQNAVIAIQKDSFPEYVSVTLKPAIDSSYNCRCWNEKQVFIPALILYYWQKVICCNLNHYNESLRLKNYLLNSSRTQPIISSPEEIRIEIEIDSMPVAFCHSYADNVIVINLSTIGISKEYIWNEQENIKIIFRVFSNDMIIKQGVIRKLIPSMKRENFVGTTSRKFIETFLIKRDERLQKIAEEIYSEIIAGI